MATVGDIVAFTNGTASSATDVNANFTALTTFLNTYVVHKDGSKALTADLSMSGYRVTNVGAGTADTDAVQRQQVDVFSAGSQWTCTGTRTVTTTATLISWDNEIADTFGWANLGSSATDFTCPSDGMYQIMVEYRMIGSSGKMIYPAQDSFGLTEYRRYQWTDENGHYMNNLWYAAFFEAGDVLQFKTYTASSSYTLYDVGVHIVKVGD